MSNPGWYPDPSGSGGQRYFDGRQWTVAAPPPAPPPRKSNGPLIVTVFVVLAVIGGCSALLGSSDDDKKTKLPSTPSSALASPSRSLLPAAEAVPPPPPAPAPLGSEVRDGKFAFVVTGVDTSKTAGDTSNPYMTQTAQGKYVNVHLTVTNIGNEPQTFWAGNQKLLIGNKSYDADSAASLWSGAMNEDINPGNSVSVTVSFDVPEAATTATAVELHDSAFSGGVLAGLG